MLKECFIYSSRPQVALELLVSLFELDGSSSVLIGESVVMASFGVVQSSILLKGDELASVYKSRIELFNYSKGDSFIAVEHESCLEVKLEGESLFRIQCKNI